MRGRSDTESAIVELRPELLVPCRGQLAERTDWSVGGLLEEPNDVAALLLPCVVRYNKLLDYLAPVVAKEQARVFAQ